ncbi:MAG: 30S ribosomal protein THX [Bacteroidota bacterium]|nr:30S ribosomal protein THX [Bacteroidota bacterium]
MGKGDKKTRKGKIFKGSNGNTRPKKEKPAVPEVKPTGKPAKKTKTA